MTNTHREEDIAMGEAIVNDIRRAVRFSPHGNTPYATFQPAPLLAYVEMLEGTLTALRHTLRQAMERNAQLQAENQALMASNAELPSPRAAKLKAKLKVKRGRGNG